MITFLYLSILFGSVFLAYCIVLITEFIVSFTRKKKMMRDFEKQSNYIVSDKKAKKIIKKCPSWKEPRNFTNIKTL